MKKSEMIRLRALVRRLKKVASKDRRLASRMNKYAGQSELSHPKYNNGDEGWVEMISLDAGGSATYAAACSLEELLERMTVRK